jgi:hypothetical protein
MQGGTSMNNGKWHAFIDHQVHVQPTLSGNLQGKSFAVKDVFSVRGHTNSAGNLDWLRTHEPAASHAKVIDQLLSVGAELQGMTLRHLAPTPLAPSASLLPIAALSAFDHHTARLL